MSGGVGKYIQIRGAGNGLGTSFTKEARAVRPQLLVVLLTPVVMLSSCVQRGTRDSEPTLGPGPAFVMALQETSCPAQTNARICFDAEIKNVGDESGSGYCEARGFSDGIGDETTLGPRYRVHALGPGQTRNQLLVWAGEPEAAYHGYCMPGISG